MLNWKVWGHEFASWYKKIENKKTELHQDYLIVITYKFAFYYTNTAKNEKIFVLVYISVHTGVCKCVVESMVSEVLVTTGR